MSYQGRMFATNGRTILPSSVVKERRIIPKCVWDAIRMKEMRQDAKFFVPPSRQNMRHTGIGEHGSY